MNHKKNVYNYEEVNRLQFLLNPSAERLSSKTEKSLGVE